MDDQDHILIRIDRERPIELDKLTLGMMALGAQYERFVKKEHPDAQEHETDLLVHRITEGSIVIELLGAMQPIFQGMDNVLLFDKFVRFLSTQFGALSIRSGRLDNATSKDLRELAHAAGMIAGHVGNSAELLAVEYKSETKERRVAARLTLRGRDADMVVENAEAQLREIGTDEPNRHNGVLMRLYQTNIGEAAPDRASGEKGIIENIDPKPRRLIYASELAGQRIKGAWAAPGVSPYDLGFVVDVDVQMVNGRPRAYRILEVHEVFPLEEDDE